MKIDKKALLGAQNLPRTDAPRNERKSEASQARQGAKLDPATLITLSPNAAMASPLAMEALAGKSDSPLSSVLQQQDTSSKEATAKLDEARQQMAEQKKSASRDRLEAVKKKLEVVQLLGGDPKTLARQAKEMAKELASAAKDYASAAKELGASAQTPPADAAATEPANSAEPSEFAGNADAKKAAEAYQSMADQSTAAFGKDRSEADLVADFKRAADGVKSLISDASRKLKSDKSGTRMAGDLQKHGDELDWQIKELGETVGAEAETPATARNHSWVNILT